MDPKPISRKRLRQYLRLKPNEKFPRVAMVAHLTDLATDKAYFDLAIRTEVGGYKLVRVPKEDVRHNPKKLRDLLSSYDADFPRVSTKLHSMLEELSQANAPNWLQMAPTLGWQNNGTAFVLRDRVVGKTRSGRAPKLPRLVPPNLSNRSMAPLGKAGDLDGWKRNVAAFAQHSSALTLALSTAFIAPLLAILSWPTFLVVLHGPGKVGKSTAALAGATVIGIGDEADLPNWNVTGAALPELAASFNDILLVLNGLESTKLNDKDLREFLKSVTYILGDGMDTRRHSSWTAPSGRRPPATWRTIALITSEQSFDEIAARAGDLRLDGEWARAINVAAVEPGCSTIIDWFPKSVPDYQREAWARGQVEALRAACKQHHGVALLAYLKFLMSQDRDDLVAELQAARDRFVEAVKADMKSEAINHAAKNMGLLYAGGILAVKAGLLPLSEVQVRNRIRRCFRRSLARASQPSTTLRAALLMLDGGLKAAIAKASMPENQALFSMPTNDSEVFVVHIAGLFAKWFDSPASRALVLGWLLDKGLLDVPDREKAIREGFKTDTVRCIRRIDGKNCASIVFRDPRPELTLALTLLDSGRA